MAVGDFIRDHWKGIAAAAGLLGVGAGLIALASAQGPPPPLGMTVDGSTDPPDAPCGSVHTLAAVGGTPNGAADFVMSTTPSEEGIVDWAACPACFEGTFDGKGNYSVSVTLVTGASASTFYVAIRDVSSGKYSSWIPVTVLAYC